MTLVRLERKDYGLIAVCAVIAAVSLFVGVKYYFRAFPEASIEFRTTKEGSRAIAESFLEGTGLDGAGYRHAAIFGFDDDAKTFLERELGVEESNKLLDTSVRLWRWQHRWFRPLQKEELQVEVTTKGEPVGFQHLLAEEAEGADLPEERARALAEGFLVSTMQRPLDGLEFVEGSLQKRPRRSDHSFTWKVRGSDVKGADYRIVVGVAGDRVASYREFLKVPDAWQRAYRQLRSKNEITGQIDTVFLLLTAVAMLVLLVLRIRRGDVRFKAAAILGGVTFFFFSVAQLNQLPSEFYSYETTTSFAGFLVAKVLSALALGLLGGAIIFLLAAAAEPLYRERFPRVLSLTSLLRPRALFTKEFFIASLVGITMTFFFFAYENVFYIIANSLGAWAPRDVAYSELLSTAVPWVYVLFFGWFPAISEEFMSRMFSIPFFERALRSRAAALVVAASIWGFGHAAYPNQPFWIRGLEVGLAGLVFGFLLLRFGIVACVIAHFSVDALYTGFILIRSQSLYYVISGTLSAGIFGVVFLLILVAYFRRGGFLPAEVTNEVEGVAPPVAPTPEPAAPEAGERAAAYRPLTSRRIAVGLAIAGGLVLLRLVPVERFGDWIDFRTTGHRAIESASTFLRGAGFDVASYERAVTPFDRTDPSAAAYLLEKGGLGAARDFYQNRVPTPLWRVRFFVPGQKEEYAVSVDPASGAVVGFSRELPEDAPGASLEKEQARELAEKFAAARGQDPKAGELKEQTAKDEKARRDHTLVWEYAAPAAGEAKVRYEVVVQGGTVGSWTRAVKIPEEWRREREKDTARTVILRFLKIPYLGLFAGFAIVLLIVKIRKGEIPWKFALVVGGLAVVPAVVRSSLSLNSLWVERYDTSVPEIGFKVTLLIAVFSGGVVFFLGGAVLAALSGALHPEAAAMFSAARRRAFARDALIAGLISLGFFRGIPALLGLLGTALPSGLLLSGVSLPGDVGMTTPALASIAGALTSAIFLPALAGVVLGILATYLKNTAVRVLLGLLLVLSFLPGGARRPSEYLLSALSIALLAGGILAIARFFLRNNPLAWVFGAWFTFGTLGAIHLLEQSAPFYRVNGALTLIVVLAPALVLLRDALAGRGADG